MDCGEINRRWQTKTLELVDIQKYIDKNVVPMDLLVCRPSIVVAADICFDLYEWAIGKIDMANLDPLCEAIINNDLDRALDCCDLNMRHGGLWIVSVFLYNCAPKGWNNMTRED